MEKKLTRVTTDAVYIFWQKTKSYRDVKRRLMDPIVGFNDLSGNPPVSKNTPSYNSSRRHQLHLWSQLIFVCVVKLIEALVLGRLSCKSNPFRRLL